MSKMTQKEAVYQAVTNVCGVQDEAYSPTKDQRASINQILFEGFRAGNVDLDREYDDKSLRTYVSGLQSNWLRKDARLNGNTKYVAKNPGSRRGSSDPQVQALRRLQSIQTDPVKVAEIQVYIDRRLAEVAPVKNVSVDVNALPLELRHMVSQ